MVDSGSDQMSQIMQYIRVVFREIYRHKYMFILAFAVISIGVLGLGFVAPKTFHTTATLYADRSNIIAPLLSGQASVTKVEDQVRVVKETIYSPTVLNKVVQQANLLSGGESPAEIEKKTNALRDNISVRGIGGSYIRVSYSSSDPDQTFNVLRHVLEVFIRDSSDAKRSESRQAYEFINSQVESYKAQLQRAEERLRAFKSSSVDGTEASVNNRITQLRGTVESLKLDIEGVRTRVRSIESELGRESQFVVQQQKMNVYRNSLAKAQQELDVLLLSYTETHPDVVALKFKIDDLKRAIIEARYADTSSETPNSDVTVNPLYEELRAELSEAKVELQTKQKRLISTEKLLEEEHRRLKRVAENQAELSELTRDYNVTKTIYEDMLERKEKARLSMTLDIEGRGLTYKIQEPPAYPLSPTGFRFMHFLAAGPVLGMGLPLGLLVMLIIVDPRIRFSSQLSRFSKVELLGVVNHSTTALRSRLLKADVIFVGLVFLAVVAVYCVAIYVKMQG